MALWRCPHCGTPQPVAARCWVCRRSSTSCGTCRHFRASVAARIGYCGLDRERRPLAGSEIRACWDGVALGEVEEADVPAVVAEPSPPPAGSYMSGFVPVDTLLEATRASSPPLEPFPEPPSAVEPAPAPPLPAAITPADGLLWADLEG
jgi:hypothetical protein